MLKTIYGLGETTVGWVADQLLSNDQFMSMVQSLVLRSLEFKKAVEGHAGVVLSSMNLATAEDSAAIQDRLDSMQADLDRVAQMVKSLEVRITKVEQGPEPAAAVAPAKKAPAKKAPAKKLTVKKAPAKKLTVKKSAEKKTAAKKGGGKGGKA